MNVFKKTEAVVGDPTEKKQQSSEDTKHGDLNEARQAVKDRNRKRKTRRPGQG